MEHSMLTSVLDTIVIVWTLFTVPGQIHSTYCAVRDLRAARRPAAPTDQPDL